MRYIGIRLGVALGITLGLAFCPQAQAKKSQKELEDEVLKGTPPPSSSDAPAASNARGTRTEDLPDDVEKDPNISERDVRKVEDAIVGPKRIPRDQILVVQRKYIEKVNRHEIIPILFGAQLSDSFRHQVQWGFGYAYHLSEMFGIEVLHANVITNYSTGLNKQVLKQLNLDTDRVEPVFSLGSSLQFTPLRSKAAAWSSTVYFEGFFLAGGGMTRYQTSTAGMAMAGVGFRVFLTRYAILKAEFRNYTDFIKGGGHNNRFNILTGASVMFGGDK